MAEQAGNSICAGRERQEHWISAQTWLLITVDQEFEFSMPFTISVLSWARGKNDFHCEHTLGVDESIPWEFQMGILNYTSNKTRYFSLFYRQEN